MGKLSTMAPFKTVQLDHVVVRVRDIDAAKAFYCDVVGATIERELVDLGLYQLRIGGALIDLVPVGSTLGKMGGGDIDPERRNMDHFAVRVEPFNIDEIRAHLAAHNVEPSEVGIRYGAEGDGPSVYIQDPDGNTVELKGPPGGSV